MAGIGHRGFMGRKKSGSFTPLDDADLIGWYPYDVTAGITESGGSVSNVVDASGNGRDISSVGSKQPITGVNTLNGMNIIDFNDSNLRYTPIEGAFNTITFIQVLRRTSNSPTSQITTNSSNISNRGRTYVRNNVPEYQIRQDNTLSGGSGAPLNDWIILCAIYNGIDSYLRENGVELISGDVGNATNIVGYEFGTSGNNGANNPAQYFVGNMAEQIVTAANDLATIEEYETYLNTKWNLGVL